MKAKGPEALLSWYRRAKREGLPVPVARSPLAERVCATRRMELDLRLGEAAQLLKRLDELFRPLSEAERTLLFSASPEEPRARSVFYKRRARLVNKLRPALLEAGLLMND